MTTDWNFFFVNLLLVLDLPWLGVCCPEGAFVENWIIELEVFIGLTGLVYVELNMD